MDNSQKEARKRGLRIGTWVAEQMATVPTSDPHPPLANEPTEEQKEEMELFAQSMQREMEEIHEGISAIEHLLSKK